MKEWDDGIEMASDVWNAERHTTYGQCNLIHTQIISKGDNKV